VSGPVRALVVLLAFLTAGLLVGVVWEALWSPVQGVALGGEWVPAGEAARESFSGTGLYVLLCAGAGVATGLLAALVARGHEVIVLGAVVVGSTAAGVLAAQVGHRLGPPDPRVVAQGLEDYAEVTADLSVSGWTPYLAFPAAALASVVLVWLLLPDRRNAGRRAVRGDTLPS
jgi:hypothetical protein